MTKKMNDDTDIILICIKKLRHKATKQLSNLAT